MTAVRPWRTRLKILAHAMWCSLVIGWSLLAGCAASAADACASGRPLTYHDAGSGITLSVQPDGRHVVATNRRHEVLWRADPFADAELAPYRTAYPVIVYIGPLESAADAPAHERAAAIRFDSTQFGKIDLATGRFVFLGQD